MPEQPDIFSQLRDGLSNGTLRNLILVHSQPDGQVGLSSLGALSPVEALGMLALAQAMVTNSVSKGGEPSRLIRVQ